jgi:hypothetical protein
MTTCICQDESFVVGDSRATKLTAIVSFVRSLMPSTRALGSD